MRRPFLKFPTLLLAMSLSFVACNEDDDPYRNPASTDNTNSNATRYFSGVTENSKTTDIHQASTRLEIPQLRGGANDLFIVHTVPTYGINYCMEYDCSLRAQRWSAFRWDSKTIAKAVTRTDAWLADPLIPSEYQTDQSDYSGSGYTRGHIVASEDRVYSQAANEQTFYYSNMHPQLYSFNTEGVWWDIENKLIRNRYCNFDINKTSYFCDTLYVVKGGSTGEGQYTWVKGRGNRLVCPKYFFVALLRKSSKDLTQGGYAAIGFWMEHKNNDSSYTAYNYTPYALSIKDLEAKTGLDFFCNLPDDIEKQVESNLVLSTWGLR